MNIRDNHRSALAGREGFAEDDCGIDAVLTSNLAGGVAFRVQDKNNYCFLSPTAASQVTLWIVRDGIPTAVQATVPGAAVNWSQPHRWLIRAAGDNLDVAVQAGTWRAVFTTAGNPQRAGERTGIGGHRPGDHRGHQQPGGLR